MIYIDVFVSVLVFFKLDKQNGRHKVYICFNERICDEIRELESTGYHIVNQSYDEPIRCGFVLLIAVDFDHTYYSSNSRDRYSPVLDRDSDHLCNISDFEIFQTELNECYGLFVYFFS